MIGVESIASIIDTVSATTPVVLHAALPQADFSPSSNSHHRMTIVEPLAVRIAEQGPRLNRDRLHTLQEGGEAAEDSDNCGGSEGSEAVDDDGVDSLDGRHPARAARPGLARRSRFGSEVSVGSEAGGAFSRMHPAGLGTATTSGTAPRVASSFDEVEDIAVLLNG